MIPPFTANGLLDTRVGYMFRQHSPFEADCVELVERYGFSPERRRLLRLLLEHRAEFYRRGLVRGETMIGGSFLDDCETTLGRPPSDIDALVILTPNHPVPPVHVMRKAAEELTGKAGKERYCIDARMAVPGVVRRQPTYRLIAKMTQLLGKDRLDRARGILLIPFDRDRDAKAADLLAASAD